jgi:hypothetical protein
MKMSGNIFEKVGVPSSDPEKTTAQLNTSMRSKQISMAAHVFPEYDLPRIKIVGSVLPQTPPFSSFWMQNSRAVHSRIGNTSYLGLAGAFFAAAAPDAFFGGISEVRECKPQLKSFCLRLLFHFHSSRRGRFDGRCSSCSSTVFDA